MKILDCVRDIELEIEKKIANNEKIIADVIGEWAAGETVFIRGKFQTTGYFPRVCIRWECPGRGNRGIFGRGLSGYNGPAYPIEQLKYLKIVK